jgi:NAD+ diphosphatase
MMTASSSHDDPIDNTLKFVSGIDPPMEPSGAAWWFAFAGDRLLVRSESSLVKIPYLVDLQELGLPILHRHYLGQLDGHSCYAVELSEDTVLPADMAFEGLREVYGRLDENLFWIAARAVQIVNWDRTHQFCSRCGTAMETKSTERAKGCPSCGLLHFPRLSPAIIVLVERGQELLLARSRHFAPGRYSVIAGFVEPGETLEETVVREIREEVGIRVKDIRYFGSQAWPFPHQLMIGFTATYHSGEITLNDGEIEDARWFTPDNLPTIPTKISISRKLIDWFLAKHNRACESD